MVDLPDARLLRDLPTAHAVALRLVARGAAAAEIAETLGLAPEAVPGLLAIAHAKLAELDRAISTGDLDGGPA